MLKKVLEPVKTILESRIIKLGTRKGLLKHQDYIVKAKEIWEMIDKDFGITNTIENVLKLKVDKFEQTLIKKFPELNSKDIEDLMKKIINGATWNETIELSRNDALKQLQEISIKLKEENEKLKDELKKITSSLSENAKSNNKKE